MQLLEHEGKALLAAAGVAVPAGRRARTPSEARAAAQELGGPVVVKAQVPAGGRGKAGGIVTAADAAGTEDAAARLLAGSVRGHPVSEVLVERAIEPERELFVAVTVDARARRPVLLLSASGGVDVEVGSQRHVGRAHVAPGPGLRAFHVWQAAAGAGIPRRLVTSLVPVAQALARVFTEQRAQTVEVNPLFVSADGDLVAGDARVVPDPALGRPAAGDSLRRISGRLGFDFIELDPEGDVGLLTTGAGASMMLIDLLAEAGARPINFCDLRTGGLRGDPARLVFALEALGHYRRLEAIAVNVFAGVTNLDEFAALLLRALSVQPPRVPTLVRLEGRGAAAARERVRAAGLSCPETLEQLVSLVVAELGRRGSARRGAPA